jgi:hypothetical protein
MKTLGALLAILLSTQAVRADEPEGYGKTQGIIPGIPLLFGPKLSVALPHPSIGLEVKFDNFIGGSFDYGFIPDITVSNASANMKGWHLDGRVYPFRGAFFLGAALGRRTMEGSYTDTTAIPGTSITGKATVDVTYLAPEIGWRWVYQSGLFMGVELGWEFVLSMSTQYNDQFNALPDQKKNDINSAIDKYGKVGLPHLALFQIGYFF